MEVLVAGAGIAGLSAAIAMKKARHDVAVAERATEMREIGAALSLWPNALAALDRLGVGETVRGNGIEAPTGTIRSMGGATMVRFDTGAMCRALGGLPVIVLRAGLQAALLAECARLGIELRLGEAVQEVQSDGRRATVTTSRQRVTFDAVIGADGINSKVRAAVVDGNPHRDCDRIAWRALIPNRDSLVSYSWLSVGIGLQLIASPAPDGLIYWAADTPGADAPAVHQTDPRVILRGRFGRWHSPIPEIIEATPAESLIVNRIVDRPPPRVLHRGPILLTGDAAHAMTPDLGQGACQAIEDAALLLALAEMRPAVDPAVLFASFETVRLSRVRRIVRDSYGIGRVATTQSRLGAGARDLLTRLVPESLNNRRLAAYASVAAFQKQLRGAAA